MEFWALGISEAWIDRGCHSFPHVVDRGGYERHAATCPFCSFPEIGVPLAYAESIIPITGPSIEPKVVSAGNALEF